MSASFEPLRAKRTFEIIVDLIKDRIFAGELRPGDRLPAERELAQMLEVGRPAVREAFRALELFGIVEIRKGKGGGAYIQHPGHRSLSETIGHLIRLREISLEQLTEARLILEKDVAELAVRRATPQGIERLEACIDEALAVAASGHVATEANVRFHLLLAEMSGNPILVLILSSVMDLLVLFIRARAPSAAVSHEIAEDHRRIVEALRSRDAERFWTILEAHIRSSNGRLTELDNGGPPPGKGLLPAKIEGGGAPQPARP